MRCLLSTPITRSWSHAVATRVEAMNAQCYAPQLRTTRVQLLKALRGSYGDNNVNANLFATGPTNQAGVQTGDHSSPGPGRCCNAEDRRFNSDKRQRRRGGR